MANVTKLHRELAEAGLPVTSVDANGDYWLGDSATPDDYAAADAIVAAHDPVDYDALNAETSRAEMYAQFAVTIADYTDALANWETLTNAQLNAVMRRNTKVLKNVLLYLKRELGKPIE